jgi:hypothetical protein
MSEEPAAVHSIFDKWNSLSEFAADAGVTYGSAKQMRRRGSIPVRYWPSLLKGAQARDIEVTETDLISAHAHVDAEDAA